MVERGRGVKREDGDGEKALLFKESSVMTHEDSHPNDFFRPQVSFLVFLRCDPSDLGGGRGWVGAPLRLSEALV